MEKIPYITTAIALVFAAIFALLNQLVWPGFAYFVLSVLMLLAAFWGGWLVYLYATTFKKELDERFQLYRAQTINSGAVTSSQFDANLPVYQKDFNKKMRKIKFVKIFGIVFCFACAGLFLAAMILR